MRSIWFALALGLLSCARSPLPEADPDAFGHSLFHCYPNCPPWDELDASASQPFPPDQNEPKPLPDEQENPDKPDRPDNPDNPDGRPDAKPEPPGLQVCCGGDDVCGFERHCRHGRCRSDFGPDNRCDRDGDCFGGERCERGRCVILDSGCAIDCERLPGYDLYFQWDGTDLENPSDAYVEGVVIELWDEGFRLDSGGGPESFALHRPGLAPPPVAVGEKLSIRARSTGEPLYAWSVEIIGTAGPRYAARGGPLHAPVSLFGITMHIEESGCGANVIGDCALSRNAIAVLEDGISIPATTGHGRSVSLQGVSGKVQVTVDTAVMDENACYPEANGPFLALEILPL